MTYEEWKAEGTKRFGGDMLQWRFVCPSCGHVAKVDDWKQAGAPEGAVAFSCVGRWRGGDDKKSFRNNGGPCFYTGGGLFKINPVRVVHIDGKEHNLFAFAP